MPARDTMQAVFRLTFAWLLVMAAAAAGLMVLDRVPALLAGTPHGARVFRSLGDAERAVGARIRLPGYYPDDLAWPPASIEVSSSLPRTVVVRLAARADGRERVVVAQSVGGVAAPPEDLLPPGQVMEQAPVQVGPRTVLLVRLLVGPRQVNQVGWDQHGRRLTIRSAGSVEQLLLMAESLERVFQ